MCNAHSNGGDDTRHIVLIEFQLNRNRIRRNTSLTNGATVERKRVRDYFDKKWKRERAQNEQEQEEEPYIEIRKVKCTRTNLPSKGKFGKSKFIYCLSLNFTLRSAPLSYFETIGDCKRRRSVFTILVRSNGIHSIPFSLFLSLSLSLQSVTSATLTHWNKDDTERKYKYNEIRIMPFAIDLKFIYDPLTSDSYRPTFNAEKPKEKKLLVFHTAPTLAYAVNDKRKKPK